MRILFDHTNLAELNEQFLFEVLEIIPFDEYFYEENHDYSQFNKILSGDLESLKLLLSSELQIKEKLAIFISQNKNKFNLKDLL